MDFSVCEAGRPLVLGILGCGNMGSAIARGVQANAKLAADFALHVFARNADAGQAMQAIDARLAPSAPALAEKADILLLAVKPHQMAGVLVEIAPTLEAKNGRRQKTVLLSVAAGISLKFLRKTTKECCLVARAMPNTLVTVGQGLFALCFDKKGEDDAPLDNAVRRLLGGLGRVVELEESQMNAFTALAGCGPAYVFHFMESLVEAGVSAGISRKNSREIALSLLCGCAALAQQSKEHPALLREQVSSPGGMTIAGLNHLDRCGSRGHMVDAVLAALARGKTLESEN